MATDAQPGVVVQQNRVAVRRGAGDRKAAAGRRQTGHRRCARRRRLRNKSRQPACPRSSAKLALLEYPHDVIRHHMKTLADNLSHRLREGQFVERADGVFVAEGAELGQYLVTDSRQGPIVHRRATRRSGRYSLSQRAGLHRAPRHG